MSAAVDPAKSRVLLVDDDAELLNLLADYLARDGFEVTCLHDGEVGAREAVSGDYDIVVLDVTMPVMSGVQALARIRTSSTIPVLMLTARGDDADRIVGLELGADDYVPKPCSPRELAARLRAILKRVRAPIDSGLAATQPLQVGSLCLWPGKRRAEYRDAPLELTSTEFSLLEMLARYPGQAVSKARLSEEALGRPLSRFDRSIDVHISSIRHKLGPLPDGSSLIETVIRKGYLLVQA